MLLKILLYKLHRNLSIKLQIQKLPTFYVLKIFQNNKEIKRISLNFKKNGNLDH